jgi:hypothetical protein
VERHPLATGSSLSGTTGAVAKFTASNAVGDSIMTESGAVITVTSTLNATAALQIGGASINTAGTLANVAYLNAAQTFSNVAGQTFAGGIGLSGGSPSTHGINIPSAVPGMLTTNLHNAGGLLIWTGGATFPGNVTVTTMNTYTFDQSVASGASPTFTGTNITGIPDGALSANVALLNAANTFSNAASQNITRTAAGDALVISNGGATPKAAYFYSGASSIGWTTATGLTGNGFTADASAAYLVVAGSGILSASASGVSIGGDLTLAQSAAGNRSLTGDRTDAEVTVRGGSTGAAIQFFGSTYTNYAGAMYLDTTTDLGGTNDGDFVFRPQGVEKMRLDSAGLLTLSANMSLSSEAAAYIGFTDTTNGIAGYIGPAEQIIASGTVDHLGLYGVSGISFSPNSGASTLMSLSSAGLLTVSGGGAFPKIDSTTPSLTVGATATGSMKFTPYQTSHTYNEIAGGNAENLQLTVSGGGAFTFSGGAATFTGAVTMSNYGAGTATFDASGNITSVSDERYKDRIAPLGYGLAEVLALSPVQHGYNDLSKLDRESLYGGFLAQDVQQVMPLAVNANPDGYLSLSDRPILGSVVNAIKELSARMDAAGL